MYTDTQIKILNNIKNKYKLEISRYHKNFQVVSKIKDIIKNYNMSVNYSDYLSLHYNVQKINHSIIYDAWSIIEKIDKLIQYDDYTFVRYDENKYIVINCFKENVKQLSLFYNFEYTSDCSFFH